MDYIIRIVLLCVFIWSQVCIIDARTRYEEFDTMPGYLERLCVSKIKNQPIDSAKCYEFCQTKTTYATGGCDCKTLKCVCADMSLDFCDFARIRLHI